MTDLEIMNRLNKLRNSPKATKALVAKWERKARNRGLI